LIELPSCKDLIPLKESKNIEKFGLADRKLILFVIAKNWYRSSKVTDTLIALGCLSTVHRLLVPPLTHVIFEIMAKSEDMTPGISILKKKGFT